MRYRKATTYVLSLPERLVRSTSGILAGAAQELGEVILPARVRRSSLYSAIIGTTLQFLIEQVAEIEKSETTIPQDFLLRKVTGSVIDLAGIATFHASPLWVFAAMSDLAGSGREVVQEVAEALREAHLLKPDTQFHTVNELLTGLEQTAGQMVQSIHMPPLNVAALRADWRKLCAEASRIPIAALPNPKQIWTQWHALKAEASNQERSVVELSSLLAIAAIRDLPHKARWLSHALLIGGERTGGLVANHLLDHYRRTLDEIRQVGYAAYWLREFQPYLKGALRQLSLQRESTTERLLNSAWPRS